MSLNENPVRMGPTGPRPNCFQPETNTGKQTPFIEVRPGAARTTIPELPSTGTHCLALQRGDGQQQAGCSALTDPRALHGRGFRKGTHTCAGIGPQAPVS